MSASDRLHETVVMPHNRVGKVWVASLHLTVMDCWNCGIPYAVPAGFDEKRREDGGAWYCPNGHGTKYGESDADRAKKEAKRLKQERDWARTAQKAADERAEAAERSRAAQKGANTKLRKRIANGVCPCCKRSFKDLHRHMAGQHPDYVEKHE